MNYIFNSYYLYLSYLFFDNLPFHQMTENYNHHWTQLFDLSEYIEGLFLIEGWEDQVDWVQTFCTLHMCLMHQDANSV